MAISRDRGVHAARLLRAVSLIAAGALVLGMASAARADNIHEVYRGTRALGFGGAFAAVADDEQAIFYNPAGLAGVKQLGLQFASIDLEASVGNLLSLSSDLNSLQNLSGSTINSFIGKNVYGRAQFVPSIVMPNFGFALLSDGQVAMIARNQALPEVTVGYQMTNGVQFAYGTSLLGRKAAKRTATSGGNDFRVGFAGKILWRRGGYRKLSTIQLLNASADTLTSIAGNYSMGYGGDVGLQWLRQVGKGLGVSAGLVWTDIGKFAFPEGGDPVSSNLSFGVASKFAVGQLSSVTFAMDYRQLLSDEEWKKKLHFGFELSIPVIKLYAGFNQLALTYGFATDLWLFRFTAISTAEEFGTLVGQDRVRTYALKLALKIGL